MMQSFSSLDMNTDIVVIPSAFLIFIFLPIDALPAPGLTSRVPFKPEGGGGGQAKEVVFPSPMLVRALGDRKAVHSINGVVGTPLHANLRRRAEVVIVPGIWVFIL
jgi:hypothetical protein